MNSSSQSGDETVRREGPTASRSDCDHSSGILIPVGASYCVCVDCGARLSLSYSKFWTDGDAKLSPEQTSMQLSSEP